MYEISKIDAFRKIVEALNSGEKKRAEKMMKILIKSMQSDKETLNNTLNIIIKDEDSDLFN